MDIDKKLLQVEAVAADEWVRIILVFEGGTDVTTDKHQQIDIGEQQREFTQDPFSKEK